jgi:hypothetical protein
MKVFHCDHCQNLVFFENVQCVNCEHPLAYLPNIADMVSLEPVRDGVWRSPARAAAGREFRLCQNYSVENVCNWAVPANDPNPLCESCRLTRVIPDLSEPANRAHWYRLENAKRRLVYTLMTLQLPLASKLDDPNEGLSFEFVGDPPSAEGTPILTGHNEGVITLNIAEADDAEREKRRLSLGEPYRTLLGHFRHESAHYYWDRLIRDSVWIDAFRETFGDERADYGKALADYYQTGAPVDWQQHFVSAYASAHPWEDWAETWAHYLHMIDTLETAAGCGLSLRPKRSDEPRLDPPLPRHLRSFDAMIERWFPLTYALNNLNRGLGLLDAYPFVLSPSAVSKLRFVHDVIAGAKPTTDSACKIAVSVR